MQKIEIDPNKALEPGDKIELHFKSVGLAWLQAAQIASIDWILSWRKDFDILNWQIPESNKVIFTVRVNKTNPVVVTAAIIGAAIIGAGVMAWLTLDKVYQIVESPAGKVGFAGFGAGAAIAAITGLLALLKKK